MRTLLQCAYAASTQAEREPTRADPCQSALRQRLAREVVCLCGRLHTLRPTLVLPPLRQLACVLASDVADSKTLTGIFSGIGFAASYSWTLPLRAEAEQAAGATRLLWLCVGYLSGGRWTLGFDNVNQMKRFLNGGCLDMIGAAAFHQAAPLRAEVLSREPPDLALIDESILRLSPEGAAACSRFQLRQFGQVRGAAAAEASGTQVELSGANAAMSLTARAKRALPCTAKPECAEAAAGSCNPPPASPVASPPTTRQRCRAPDSEPPLEVVVARHTHAPKDGGAFEQNGLAVQVCLTAEG
jgi:hypothetical protein